MFGFCITRVAHTHTFQLLCADIYCMVNKHISTWILVLGNTLVFVGSVASFLSFRIWNCHSNTKMECVTLNSPIHTKIISSVQFWILFFCVEPIQVSSQCSLNFIAFFSCLLDSCQLLQIKRVFRSGFYFGEQKKAPSDSLWN